MRGEASRIADRESRDLLASKLRDTREDAWRIGNELFVITSLLDGNVRIERALTDVSRPLEDKVAVLNTLLGDQVHPMTMEIMTEVVKRRWSRAADIANAVEDFGVDAMMYYADATDSTLQVSIELAELHSALLNTPVVRAKLYDGSYHPVDSSEMAFKTAARIAYKQCINANPVLLEPIMHVEISVPDEYMGDIMGDLNKRRGRILGMEQSDGKQLIIAEVPQAEMFKYATDLRSMTQAKGAFKMNFERYEEVPQAISSKIIEAHKADLADDEE